MLFIEDLWPLLCPPGFLEKSRLFKESLLQSMSNTSCESAELEACHDESAALVLKLIVVAPSPSIIAATGTGTTPASFSTISANPLQSPFSLGPRHPLDSFNGAAIRRASIVLFRNDLRVHDNECLNSAHNESVSVLPVYCFDPKGYGKSSSGFDKTDPYRASFLVESVADLRRNLQARRSDLVVRIGKPETVMVELAKAIGADAIYAHREVSRDEVKEEENSVAGEDRHRQQLQSISASLASLTRETGPNVVKGNPRSDG